MARVDAAEIEVPRSETQYSYITARLGAQREGPARVSARRPFSSAWGDDLLAFDGETLNEAIAPVSQQTGWRFDLADPSLGNERVGGYIQADPEAFIALLSTNRNLEARREGERRVVLSRRT